MKGVPVQDLTHIPLKLLLNFSNRYFEVKHFRNVGENFINLGILLLNAWDEATVLPYW